MSLAIYDYQSAFDHRIFVNVEMKQSELASLINKNIDRYFGASIRSYNSFTGPLLKVIGIAIPWQIDNKIYYLNVKSLQKYFYRLFTISPNVGQLEKKVLDEKEYFKLPIYKSTKPDACVNSFKFSKAGWMSLMTSRYIFHVANGYRSSVLDKLNPSFLIKVLSRKI